MRSIIYTAAFAGLLGMSACHNSAQEQANQRELDSMKIELARKRTIDSMNEVTRLQSIHPDVTPAAAGTNGQAVVATSTKKTSTSSYAAHSPRRTHTYVRSTQAQPVVYQQAPARKRGWSAKAKGAVIGAGTGAVVGAVVNKRNRAAGAVIGTLIGAGAGTGVGAVIDKKKGR